MNPEEIHAALSITPLPPPFDLLGESLPHRTAFALLARVAGVPLVALNLSGTEFAERFPKTAIPKEARAEFGADLRRYRAWRTLLLDCLILGSLDQVDQEPWDSVRRVARLSLGKTAANNLYYVSAAIPAGLAARDLTFDIAFEIDQTLCSVKRQGFRAGLRDLDRLHDSAFAVVTGLLPTSTIGRLPAPAAHTTHAPLPPRLATLYRSAPKPIRAALPFVWRLVNCAGLIPANSDPSPDEFVAIVVRPESRHLDPREFGFARPSGATYRAYLARLVRHFRPDLPAPLGENVDESDAETAWRAARRACKAMGVPQWRIKVLSSVSVLACADGVGPADVTSAWCAATAARLSEEQVRPFRSGCFLLDELHDDRRFPAALRAREHTGIIRQRPEPGCRSGRTPIPSHKREAPIGDPVELAWAEFFREARRIGIDEVRLHALYALRSAAVEKGFRPDALTKRWVIEAREAATRSAATKIAMAARLIEEFRQHPPLQHMLPVEPLGPLPDRRFSAGPLMPEAEAALDDLLAFEGGAASTRRSSRIAVRALLEATDGAFAGSGDLRRLLETDLEDVEWGEHAQRAPRYIGRLVSLRTIARLSLCPSWNELQRRVVAAGVSMQDNPLPILFERSNGLEPNELDWPWAQALVRYLRSPNENSRHGRADLAKTLARNIARMDRLHEIPEIAESGLLPRIIGPLR